jgi:3D (Asp-Asp-Asp) domain-containing protein
MLCVAFLSACLVGGLVLQPLTEASGHPETITVQDAPAPAMDARAFALVAHEVVTPPAPIEADQPLERVSHDASPVETPDNPSDEARDDGQSERLYRICRVTAYCDRGTTAAGVPSGVGQCAAPGYIPLGSYVYIPALDRTFVVTDRTHRRFRNSTVDIFIPSKRACRKFGRQFLACEFILPPDRAAND